MITWASIRQVLTRSGIIAHVLTELSSPNGLNTIDRRENTPPGWTIGFHGGDISYKMHSCMHSFIHSNVGKELFTHTMGVQKLLHNCDDTRIDKNCSILTMMKINTHFSTPISASTHFKPPYNFLRAGITDVPHRIKAAYIIPWCFCSGADVDAAAASDVAAAVSVTTDGEGGPPRRGYAL